MILNFLIDLLLGFVKLILKGFNIPPLPAEVGQMVGVFVQYIQTGIGILSNYCNIKYVMNLFGIILIVDAAILGYRFIMWVLRKIPMFGIS